tara:strand:- start:9205 stop:10410 length:1206 start_codon:yes stop_codon:yes gene_type:complete
MVGLISINYKTSPLDIREHVYVSESEIVNFNNFLRKSIIVNGSFIMSTCNRTEIYFDYDQNKIKKKNISHKIISCLINFKKISEGISPYVEKKFDKDVYSHIFRVASGLESMIIGEYQIVEQIKSAYKLCNKNKMLSPILERMIQKSLNASKLIRTKTKIDKGAVSVSYAAVEKINKKYSKKSISIVNVGTGKTGELTLKHLIKKKYENIQILNRTINKSKKISEKLNLKYQPLENIYKVLSTCDIIIFSTSSPKKLITINETIKSLSNRKKPLLVIDLSVPTNVPKEIKNIKNVNLINVDGLKDEVNKNYIKRKKESFIANKYINNLVNEFIVWVMEKEIRDTINKFHEDFEYKFKEIKNIESQSILDKYKQNIINNIKNIDLTKDQDTISIVNNILLRK